MSLHLVTRQKADIPVILTDTGYLFPETYQFIDQLTEKLDLNLQVFRAAQSPAWQEARYGKLWEQGIEGIERYNQINKVEPMNRALETLQARTWFAGLRRDQSGSRAHLPVLAIKKAFSSCCRSSTGTTARFTSTCNSTALATTRCGSRATFQSAIRIPRVNGSRAWQKKRPASLA